MTVVVNGSDYLFGGPVMMQREPYGPLEYCVWRQNVVSGVVETRVVPKTWGTKDPRAAFADATD
jgi:hypothetical protein